MTPEIRSHFDGADSSVASKKFWRQFHFKIWLDCY
jgi:hypothetical protein